MKQISIKNLLACLYLAIIPIGSLQASTYGPGLLFHKPYNPAPYQSCFYMAFTEGNTTQAYNENGAVVPYLQEYGPEDFLKRFIDPTLPMDNIETLGTIDFDGQFNFQQLNLFYSKNIHKNLFLCIATSIRNLSLTKISTNIHFDPGVILNPEQLKGLDRFESKIPKSMDKSGIFATAIELGYNKLWNDFDDINFIQFFMKGAISIPQWMIGRNIGALQYPIAGNITFSYPITAILSVGLLKHVNFGLYTLMIPLQPTQLFLPVNPTESNNQILLSEATRVQVNPKPLFSTVLYMELHDFVPKCQGTIGYGYAHGMQWSLTSLNEREFPSEKINQTKILGPWSISTMFFQLDYSFKSEKNPNAPNILLFYTVPIAGVLYPKMNTIGGAYYLNFTYDF